MTDIKRTMIASLLIEQATELKGKRPTELGFEDLVDVVQGVVKKCSIPAVVGQSEQLVCDSCGCHPNVIYTTSKGRFCERCKPAN
jgi:hypothetical protein